MTIANNLPSNLADFRDSYIQLFGVMPPLPGAKFDAIAGIDPESLRLAEQQRAHAFYSDVFDIKTTQLILFGMLLHAGVPAAKFHALAARRAGASWEELQKVTELAAAAAASGPMNNGGSILKDLRTHEQK
jgi:alkylhydroperoxidase/carboxymuconolactone decarboxylase family protein YurZ